MKEAKRLKTAHPSAPATTLFKQKEQKDAVVKIHRLPRYIPRAHEPDWLVQEDKAILQVIQELQGIPLSGQAPFPSRTPNWDLASEAVFSVSRNYRSPRDCQNRYETVIVPREEGKILCGTNLEATEGINEDTNQQPMKTSELFVQDNNSSFTKVINDHYQWIMEAAARRRASERQRVLPPPKNWEVASILAENGIDYDAPLSPLQIATNKAERYARKKRETQTVRETVVRTPAVESSVPTTPQVSEQQVAIAVSVLSAPQAQAVVASPQQAQQLQAVDGAITNPDLQRNNLQNNEISEREFRFNELLKENLELKKANFQIKEKIDYQEKLKALYEENFSLHERSISNTKTIINHLKEKVEADEKEISSLKLQMDQNKMLQKENLPPEVAKENMEGRKEDLN